MSLRRLRKKIKDAFSQGIGGTITGRLMLPLFEEVFELVDQGFINKLRYCILRGNCLSIDTTGKVTLLVPIMPIKVEVSARHVHLCEKDAKALFGENYKLKITERLSQIYEYLTDKRVDIIGPLGRIKNVSVLGPFRKETQVEISLTDGIKIGVDCPLRSSGDTEDTPEIIIEDPLSGRKIECGGVICARRHLHLHTYTARSKKITEDTKLIIKIPGKRELLLKQVGLRISDKYTDAGHIDTDEGNAAGMKRGEKIKAVVYKVIEFQFPVPKIMH